MSKASEFTNCEVAVPLIVGDESEGEQWPGRGRELTYISPEVLGVYNIKIECILIAPIDFFRL